MIKLCHLFGLSLLFRTANAGTLKIFVLAGQSNMEGHAEVASINTTSGRVKNGVFFSTLFINPKTRTASRVKNLAAAHRPVVATLQFALIVHTNARSSQDPCCILLAAACR